MLDANDSRSTTLSALADPTRRAILSPLSRVEATVNEIAKPFDISLPSISRTSQGVLEGAGLISRGREAQRRPCKLETAPLKQVDGWLEAYRKLWEGSFDKMDAYLNELTGKKGEGEEAVSQNRDDELFIERTFEAPVALVFRMWESRDHMLHWWGPEEFTATEIDWEPTPGRAWRGTMASSGTGCRSLAA